MTTGSIKKINLNTSKFDRLISNGQFYVDKTRLIEHFLSSSSDASLIARQRRLGKSLNMDMLRCFLTVKECCHGDDGLDCFAALAMTVALHSQ